MFHRGRFGGRVSRQLMALPMAGVRSQATASSNCIGSAAPSSSFISSASLMLAPTCNVQRREYCTPNPGSGGGGGASALDIAMKVNKLKRMHQTGQGQDKKRIEHTAWKELNSLSEAQISEADGKAVALLLSSWAYFAKFWEKGKDGPNIVDDKGAKAQSEAEK